MKKNKVIVAFILIVLFCFYLYYQNTNLKVSSYEIVYGEIPKSFDNYKIIQVSDFHNTKSNKLTEDLIEEIKLQKPNIIAITGDLIDSNKTDIDVASNFIKRIKDIAPVYFITGNHEAALGEYDTLRENLLNLGVKILDNKVEELNIAGEKINLIGIDDPNMSYNPYVSSSEKIEYALKEINYDKKNYSILLSHRPELFETYVRNDIDLVLTGHTHGGQVIVPFIGGLVSPNQGFFPKYDKGLFKENSTSMIVSRGIGNSIIPFRVNNRPELVIVNLKTD